MADVAEVEATLAALAARLVDIPPPYRSMLPSTRTIEAVLPDIDAVYHAEWRDGRLGPLRRGPAPRPDIRVRVTAEDLLALVDGRLTLAEAYATDRLGVEASLTDLLRLRAVL